MSVGLCVPHAKVCEVQIQLLVCIGLAIFTDFVLEMFYWEIVFEMHTGNRILGCNNIFQHFQDVILLTFA